MTTHKNKIDNFVPNPAMVKQLQTKIEAKNRIKFGSTESKNDIRKKIDTQLEKHIKTLKEMGYSKLQIRMILQNPERKHLLELSPMNFPDNRKTTYIV